MKNKLMGFVAALTTVAAFSMPISVNAASYDTISNEGLTQDSGKTCQTEVTAEKTSSFVITIPKTITLDAKSKSADYTITATGDIAGDKAISVVPEASFAMSSTGKEDVTASVTQTKTAFRDTKYTNALSDAEVKFGEDVSGSIAASALTAGDWKGVLQFTISIN